MIAEELRELLRTLLFLPEEASTSAVHIDSLHFFVIGVTFAGAAGVSIAAVWFIIRYRRRSPDQATPRISPPAWFELAASGALLSLFIVWWVIGYRQYVDLHQVPDDTMEVYVTGKQWMWKFAYPDGRATAGMLVVPRGEKIELLLTSRDVVHSFYVPVFRIKQDAVPGRYTKAWFEPTRAGIYRGLCAEYCGQSHSQMWAQVVVLPPSEFERWMQGETPDLVARARRNASAVGEESPGAQGELTLVERGRQAASHYGCLSCHTLDGQPHVGPTWRGLYGKQVELSDGSVVVADEDYLTESMMAPRAKVVAGFRNVMPSYAGVIEQTDVAPLLELIKSLRKGARTPPVNLPRVSAVPGTQGPWDGGVPDGSAGAPARERSDAGSRRGGSAQGGVP